MKALKLYAKIKCLVFLGLITSFQAMAQMQAAQKISFDLETTAKFNVSVPVLWDAIKEPAKWADISNGYIKSIAVSGDLPKQTRIVSFADGTERKDIITQYQPEHRFIVLKIIDPLSPAIKDNIFMFTASTEGKGLSRLDIRIKVEGDEKEKTTLLNSLKKEIDSYIGGLTKLFSEKDKIAD